MSDQPPKPHEPMPKPQRTRLIDPVECGLSKEDRMSLGALQVMVHAGVQHQEDADRLLDFLDRLPGMVEDRDRELADAEYEVLCAEIKADAALRVLTDALERGRDHAVAALYCKLAHAEIEIRRLRGLLDGESHG